MMLKVRERSCVKVGMHCKNACGSHSPVDNNKYVKAADMEKDGKKLTQGAEAKVYTEFM